MAIVGATEAVWIIKRTFLEVEDPQVGLRPRRRSMSDTEFLLPETPRSQNSPSAEKDMDEIMSVASTHAPADVSDDEVSTPRSGTRATSLCWADESDDEPAVVEEEEKTTVMLRNVPYNVSRDSVIKMMDDAGFNGLYDFIYMPIDFRSKSGFGYAFINLVSNAAAEQFFAHFNGFNGWEIKSQKVAEVTWTESNQGLDVHVDRYRNSPVMHEVVPDEFKPAMFNAGVRVAFPGPTKPIRAPRFRHR